MIINYYYFFKNLMKAKIFFSNEFGSNAFNKKYNPNNMLNSQHYITKLWEGWWFEKKTRNQKHFAYCSFPSVCCLPACLFPFGSRFRSRWPNCYGHSSRKCSSLFEVRQSATGCCFVLLAGWLASGLESCPQFFFSLS